MKRFLVSLTLAWIIFSVLVSIWQTEIVPTQQSAIAQERSPGISTMSNLTTKATANASTELIETKNGAATYVGRDTCKECHAENHELHSHHGHHKTFATTNDPSIVAMFDGRSYDSGEPYGTFTYHADEEGLFARLQEKFGERKFRLQYALGSADGAVTLLSLLPDPDGKTFAIEHRVSWFRDGDELRPTPQEDNRNPQTPADFFGLRHQGKVMEKCIDCHITRGTISEQTVVDLIPGVNCEKCHGPGSEHVRLARSSKNPPKYSVGKSDWDTESEIQLCGNCHRLPVTVSRSELREYPDELARFQPVGLLRSQCFVQSQGQLRCTTCHNPHQTIEEIPESEHVSNCVQCHQETNAQHVSCPISPSENCIECHMPARALPGLSVSFHDHWIRVHPEK